MGRQVALIVTPPTYAITVLFEIKLLLGFHLSQYHHIANITKAKEKSAKQ